MSVFLKIVIISLLFQGPFICYESGGSGGKLGGGGSKKNHNKEGGLPKLFCLMRGALKKQNLFHQDIPAKEINIVEHLALMRT